jgi:hypothetical protein
VGLDLTNVVGTIETRHIEVDGQIAFRQFLGTDIADEGEAVAELEVGLSDDVTLEARCCRNSEVATITERKYQLLPAGYSRRNGLRCARRRAVVVQDHGTGLGHSQEWVLRSIGDCNARVKARNVRYEREQQVAGAGSDGERGLGAVGLAEARNRRGARGGPLRGGRGRCKVDSNRGSARARYGTAAVDERRLYSNDKRLNSVRVVGEYLVGDGRGCPTKGHLRRTSTDAWV